MKLKVLIVDDSIIYRRAIAEALSSLQDVEVIGSAANGKIAVQKACELRPDILTLDMEMPHMDGLEVLDALHQTGNFPAVIMVSSLTQSGSRLTIQALEKGAFDFITKPIDTGSKANIEELHRELVPRIRAIVQRLEIRNILNGKQPVLTSQEKPSVTRKLAANEPESPKDGLGTFTAAKKPEMVLIGVSTGGPNALARILPQIPRDIGVPFLIVQHMPPVFTQSLAENLMKKCAIRVKEACHGEVLEANTAYIAPGGRHMALATDPQDNKMIRITDDPPENNCRPAVDYLFRSAANRFPGHSMAVILTGMGSDGALGLKLLKRHGCFIIAQDEASSVVYGMPKAAIEMGITDIVSPIDKIASIIVAKVKGHKR